MMYDEWAHLAATTRYGMPVYQTHQPHPHTIVIADQHGTQARCHTCNWTGPDRTGDPHAVALVLDDTDQHCHKVGIPCPAHQPPLWVCPECAQAGL